jgi:flagellar basal-body rod modification protein FlgD
MTIGRDPSQPASGEVPTTMPTQSPLAALKPEDFIKLFIEQLKHQDPSHPTDSSAILQQMSQISQLSASADMQKTMKDVANSVNVSLANTQVLQATQLIGKRVEIESDQCPLTKDATSGKNSLMGSVLVPSSATSTTVTISDSSGNVLKTINLGTGDATHDGLKDFTWDGIADNGNTAEPGFYKIAATSIINGKSVPLHTAGAFNVNSVALGQSGVMLNLEGIGGKDMGQIIKIL